MKKVLFVINSIGYGGAERALVNILSQNKMYQGAEVHVMLLDDEVRARELPDNVILHIANSKRRLWASFLNLHKYARKVRPDICISFLVRANITNILVSKVLRSFPCVICERMHLNSHLDIQYKGVKRLLSKLLPKYCYRYADKVLGVSSGVTEDLLTHFNVKHKNAATIFNPYDIELISKQGKLQPEFNLPKEFVISVGRLTRSKNPFLLIEAFAASKEEMPLCILGTGELHEELTVIINNNGLQDRVLLLGYASNPFSVIARAKYFISASCNEGFPNALMETMVLGVPVIMSDCPSGPAEILTGDSKTKAYEVLQAKYGLLVPLNNIDAIQSAIELYQDDQIREHYAIQAQKRSLDFGITQIAQEYWSMFESTAKAFSKKGKST